MLLFLSLAGMILSVILLYNNSKKVTSSIYLGGFFLLISLYTFTHYTLLYSDSVHLIAIIFINFGFLSYVTGPMLYWYVRSVITDKHWLSPADILHLIPMAVFLSGTFPYILTPWQYKLEIAAQLLNNPGFLITFNDVPLYLLFPKSVVFLSRPLLILIYAVLSTVLLVQHRMKRKHNAVLPRQQHMIRWIWVLLGFLYVLVISQFIMLTESFAMKDSKLFFTANLLQVLSAVGLTGLLISPYFFPGILYGMPRMQVLPETWDSSLPPGAGDYLVEMGRMIDACMIEKRPYLDPDCNIYTLSGMLGIPVHHLSYYFSEQKKKSFNDFRNEWRIHHAKDLILTGKAREMSPEAIGFSSGFSSRITFFRAFKKAEGISPETFMSRNGNQKATG